MNPPNQLTIAPTPRTDAAYFETGATMYSLAGEMKLLERELAAAKAECERLTANQRQPAEDIFVSHLCDELARLRAEVERWKTVAATMSQEREHNANETALSRAEVERLKTCGIVEIAASNLSVLDYCKHWEARAEKAEAELITERARLDWLEANPEAVKASSVFKSSFGRKVWWYSGGGNYDTARAAIDASMKNESNTP
jgi:multidrug resistance efflux pump